MAGCMLEKEGCQLAHGADRNLEHKYCIVVQYSISAQTCYANADDSIQMTIDMAIETRCMHMCSL